MYSLNLTIYDQSGRSLTPVAQLSHAFTVPPMTGGRSDEPMELESLELAIIKSVKVNDVAPGFEIQTVLGKPLRLADHKGRWVLLDFWATWCGPCIGETPNLKAAYEAFGKRDDFVMIGLSSDTDTEAPAKYAKKNELGWIQGFLGRGELASKVHADYGVNGIPSIWLIDLEGKVVTKNLRGAAIKSTIAKYIAASPR